MSDRSRIKGHPASSIFSNTIEDVSNASPSSSSLTRANRSSSEREEGEASEDDAPSEKPPSSISIKGSHTASSSTYVPEDRSTSLQRLDSQKHGEGSTTRKNSESSTRDEHRVKIDKERLGSLGRGSRMDDGPTREAGVNGSHKRGKASPRTSSRHSAGKDLDELWYPSSKSIEGGYARDRKERTGAGRGEDRGGEFSEWERGPDRRDRDGASRYGKEETWERDRYYRRRSPEPGRERGWRDNYNRDDWSRRERPLRSEYPVARNGYRSPPLRNSNVRLYYDEDRREDHRGRREAVASTHAPRSLLRYDSSPSRELSPPPRPSHPKRRRRSSPRESAPRRSPPAKTLKRRSDADDRSSPAAVSEAYKHGQDGSLRKSENGMRIQHAPSGPHSQAHSAKNGDGSAEKNKDVRSSPTGPNATNGMELGKDVQLNLMTSAGSSATSLGESYSEAKPRDDDSNLPFSQPFSQSGRVESRDEASKMSRKPKWPEDEELDEVEAANLRKTKRRNRPPKTPLKERIFYGCSNINLYDLGVKLGQGTFGEVKKARHKETAVEVALKKVTIHEEKDGMPITAIREIKLLKKLSHPAIVPIIDMAYRPPKERGKMGDVYMVEPYMDHDLNGMLENPSIQFTVAQMKLYMKQLFEGTLYLHQNKILHRDMKAANLLINNRGQLQIADFGLARPYHDPGKAWRGKGWKGGTHAYTAMVVTRWYRPPELLAGERRYGPPIDMWGLGCILAEMINRKPIFKGTSEIDQLGLIAQLCGSPNEDTFPGWSRLAGVKNADPHGRPDQDPEVPGQHDFGNYPRRVVEHFTAGQLQVRRELADLIDKLLVLDPRRRLTAQQALDHEWFWQAPYPADPAALPKYEPSKEIDRQRREHQKALQGGGSAGPGPGIGPMHASAHQQVAPSQQVGPPPRGMPLTGPAGTYGRPPPQGMVYQMGPTSGLPPRGPKMNGHGAGPMPIGMRGPSTSLPPRPGPPQGYGPSGYGYHQTQPPRGALHRPAPPPQSSQSFNPYDDYY